MATLEELVVRIKADTSALERGMQQANGIVQKSSANMAGSLGLAAKAAIGLGAALAVREVALYAKSVYDAANALQDLSDKTGVSVSFLSNLEGAVIKSGGTIETASNAIFIMSSNIGEAAKGNEALAETFKQLGINVSELTSLTPEEQFIRISNAIGALGTNYEKAEAARAVFGRGAKELLPIINEGANALNNQNHVLEQGVSNIDSLGDAIAGFAKTTRDNFIIVIGEAIGRLDRLTESMGYSIAETERLAKVGGVIANFHQTRPDTVNAFSFTPAAKARLGMSGGTASSAIQRTTATQKKAYEEVAKASADTSRKLEDDTIRTTRIIEDHFGNALESAMFDFKNFGDAASNILMGIAKDLTRMNVIEPLKKSLTGGGGGGLLGSLLSGGFNNAGQSGLPWQSFGNVNPAGGIYTGSSFGGFFAEGGTLPAGKWGVAGENGAELIYGGATGKTIIPNGAGGGVTVMQNITVNAGVTEAVRQEVMAAAPLIANAARNSVFEQVQRGGSAARIMQGRT